MPVKSKKSEYLTIAVPKAEMRRVLLAAQKAGLAKSNWAWMVLKRELDKKQ